MLKSFDYVDYSETYAYSLENRFFDAELDIAKHIVQSLLQSGNPMQPEACFCGEKEMSLFFEKWNVGYYRCSACGSIMAGASNAIVDKYHGDEKLINLRMSVDYQNEAAVAREKSWEELLDWICFRAFRYTGKREFNIIDFSNRYIRFSEKISSSSFCKEYELRDSIIGASSGDIFKNINKADIVLCVNNLQRSMNPVEDICHASKDLAKGGLMFLTTRIGTGFDILTLRENSKIFPFEHTFLPSKALLLDLFASAGFKVLEISTPGMLDAIYVKQNSDKISKNEHFINFMMNNGDIDVMQDFQKFLQKNELSSYVQIVVQKELDRIA
jgi:hypothetical protein